MARRYACARTVSTAPGKSAQVAVVGAGVVGGAVALALARRGASVGDRVADTVAVIGEAQRHRAGLLTRFRAAASGRQAGGIAVRSEDGDAVSCEVVVNCSGLEADAIARLVGDDSFSIYPRKG